MNLWFAIFENKNLDLLILVSNFKEFSNQDFEYPRQNIFRKKRKKKDQKAPKQLGHHNQSIMREEIL